MKRLSEPKLLEQIVRLRGNISAVARAFGVDRSAVIQYIHKRPALAVALKDARESLVDDAESALTVAVAEREGWAVCFTLKCLGKDRGYIERSEVELSGRNGQPLTVLTIGGDKASMSDI